MIPLNYFVPIKEYLWNYKLSLKEAENVTKNKVGFSLDLKNLWTRWGKEIVTSTLDRGQSLKAE